jgi:ribosome-associated protein
MNNYSKDLAEFIAESAFEKKCRDICIIDFDGTNDISDFLVIVTVDSDVQMRAAAAWIERELIDRQIKVFHIEGKNSAEWMIMDYVDVVVHLFKEEARLRYNLEGMWTDSKQDLFVPDQTTSDVKSEKISDDYSSIYQAKSDAKAKKISVDNDLMYVKEKKKKNNNTYRPRAGKVTGEETVKKSVFRRGKTAKLKELKAGTSDQKKRDTLTIKDLAPNPKKINGKTKTKVTVKKTTNKISKTPVSSSNKKTTASAKTTLGKKPVSKKTTTPAKSSKVGVKKPLIKTTKTAIASSKTTKPAVKKPISKTAKAPVKTAVKSSKTLVKKPVKKVAIAPIKTNKKTSPVKSKAPVKKNSKK